MAKEVGKEDLMELDRQAQLAWDMAKAVEWYEKSAMLSWKIFIMMAMEMSNRI